jgi:hypothetical protein
MVLGAPAVAAVLLVRPVHLVAQAGFHQVLLGPVVLVVLLVLDQAVAVFQVVREVVATIFLMPQLVVMAVLAVKFLAEHLRVVVGRVRKLILRVVWLMAVPDPLAVYVMAVAVAVAVLGQAMPEVLAVAVGAVALVAMVIPEIPEVVVVLVLMARQAR